LETAKELAQERPLSLTAWIEPAVVAQRSRKLEGRGRPEDRQRRAARRSSL